jgi:hypothetical protein
LAALNDQVQTLKSYHDDEEQAVGQYVSAFLRQLDGREKIQRIQDIFTWIHEQKVRRLGKENETQGAEVGFT